MSTESTPSPSPSHPSEDDTRRSNQASTRQPSVWDYKPWWCQPWSILLTGNGAIALSWFLLHRLWLTLLVALPLLAWMGFFLLIFPKAVAESGLLADMQQEKN